MKTNTYPEPALSRENPLPLDASLSSSAKADAALEFSRFRVLLRQRQLLADGIPVELGCGVGPADWHNAAPAVIKIGRISRIHSL